MIFFANAGHSQLPPSRTLDRDVGVEKRNVKAPNLYCEIFAVPAREVDRKLFTCVGTLKLTLEGGFGGPSYGCPVCHRKRLRIFTTFI